MTPKQIEVLTHIHLHGSDDLSHLPSRVLCACNNRGWIEIDHDQPWAYGEKFNECAWVLTNAGRLALHEATS